MPVCESLDTPLFLWYAIAFSEQPLRCFLIIENVPLKKRPRHEAMQYNTCNATVRLVDWRNQAILRSDSVPPKLCWRKDGRLSCIYVNSFFIPTKKEPGWLCDTIFFNISDSLFLFLCISPSIQSNLFMGFIFCLKLSSFRPQRVCVFFEQTHMTAFFMTMYLMCSSPLGFGPHAAF